VRRRPETRKEFEADPGAFALKVVAFKNTQRRSSRPRALARPEVRRRGKHRGNRSLQNMAAEVAKATGIQFV